MTTRFYLIVTAFALLAFFWLACPSERAAGNPLKNIKLDEVEVTPEFQRAMDYYHQEDYEKALTTFKEAADKNDIQAIIQIGLMYDFGKGVKQDYNIAMKWYMKAAEEGDAGGMYLVGHMYEFGEGMNVDPGKAFEWYVKSARMGNSIAQFEVGRILLNENIDGKSHAEGIAWLKIAAGQCHHQARKLLQSVAADQYDPNACPDE